MEGCVAALVINHPEQAINAVLEAIVAKLRVTQPNNCRQYQVTCCVRIFTPLIA
jgi:hypothetical protein